MCLAIPGKVIEIVEDSPAARSGRVSFEGPVREVNLSFVPEARVGDYVLVHVGFAIGVVDPEEAQRIFHYLSDLDEIDPELRETA